MIWAEPGEGAFKLDNKEQGTPGSESRDLAYPDEISDAEAAPLVREIIDLKDRNDELRAKYMRLMARCRQYHVSADKLGAQCDKLEGERDELMRRVQDLESGNELMSVVTDTWVRNLTGRSLSGAASASEKAVLIDTGFKRWSNSLDSLKANNDALRAKNEELEKERAQLADIVDSCAPVLHERVLDWGPMDPNETLDGKQRIIEDGLIDIEDMVRAAEEAAHTRREMADLEEQLAALREENRTLETDRLELSTRCSAAEADRAQMSRLANGCLNAFNDKVLDREPLSGSETIEEKEAVLRDGFVAIGEARRAAQESQAELAEARTENAALTALVNACTVALGQEPKEGATLEEREQALREGLATLDSMRAELERVSGLQGDAASAIREADRLQKDNAVLAAMVDVYAQSMHELILDQGPLRGNETLEEKGAILMDGLAMAVDLKAAAAEAGAPDEGQVEALEAERDAARRRVEELERRVEELERRGESQDRAAAGR